MPLYVARRVAALVVLVFIVRPWLSAAQTVLPCRSSPVSISSAGSYVVKDCAAAEPVTIAVGGGTADAALAVANATVASVALCSGAVGDTTLRNVTLRFDGFRAVSEGVSWMTVDCASLENVSIALVGGAANVSGTAGSVAALIYFTSSNQMVANVDISVHTTEVSVVLWIWLEL